MNDIAHDSLPNKAPDEIPFGAIIRHHRRRARLSQVRLAQIAGVGKTVVLEVEKGKRTVRLDILLRLLGALNVRLAWSSPLRASFEQEWGKDDA